MIFTTPCIRISLDATAPGNISATWSLLQAIAVHEFLLQHPVPLNQGLSKTVPDRHIQLIHRLFPEFFNNSTRVTLYLPGDRYSRATRQMITAPNLSPETPLLLEALALVAKPRTDPGFLDEPQPTIP